MCNCTGWVRTFDECPAWAPPSRHHPKCEDYSVKHYANISYCGSDGFITEFDMVDETISEWLSGGDSPEDYSVSSVVLTKDQYENLPEFDGF